MEQQLDQVLAKLSDIESQQQVIIEYLDSINQFVVQMNDYMLFGVIVLAIVGGMFFGRMITK